MSLEGMTALSYTGAYGQHRRGLAVIDIAPEIAPAACDRIVGFMAGRASFASLDEAIAYAHAFDPRRDPEPLRRTLARSPRPRKSLRPADSGTIRHPRHRMMSDSHT